LAGVDLQNCRWYAEYRSPCEVSSVSKRMAKKLDAHSFFLFSEAWGAVLLASVWIARKVIHGEPTATALSVSAPFALVMFGAMSRRLTDLSWSRLLLIPVYLTYLWILGDNVLFRDGWPIVIPGFVVSILGMYTGVLWLLISFLKGNPGTAEHFP
jgi:hypothetical protein